MRWLSRLFRSRRSYLIVFFFSLGFAAMITALTGVPGPETHDEFSYLLAADTFARGRVTNPAHSLWEHFESFHVLQQPTYQSKYQPGQGFILALGQVVTGVPIVGSWLSSALASAAVAWALRGVLPPRWATIGGLVAALHPLLMLWSQNYWGGSLAALGGAFVFGAAARAPSLVTAMTMAGGILLLINTRPYEGTLFSAIVFAPRLLRASGREVTLMCVPFVICGLGWTAYYNWRVTGSPWRLPYLVHEQQYALAPPLLLQPESSEKQYRHEAMRRYNAGIELTHYQRQRTPIGFLGGTAEKLKILAKGYLLQPGFAVGLLALPWATRRRQIRTGIWMLGAFLCVLMLSNWSFPHYAAPAVVLAAFLGVSGVRILAARRQWVIPALLGVSVATSAWWVVNRVRTLPTSWGAIRGSLVADLQAEPGDDLVIVRDRHERNVNTDWVYNGADIDAAPVIFARDMGEEANARLLRHFAGRKIWLLDDGATPPIVPYPGMSNE